VGLDYKERFVAALEVRSGQAVVDVGCGPGTDLGRLADAVGGDGWVVGVDRPNVELRHGDAHELPLPDGSVDRARMDRVLQHVLDPARALAEVRRVLRPGGLFGLAEPDWDTLAVADEDVETSRRFAGFVAGRVRNPTIGRELVRLSAQAGCRVRSVEPVAVLFRDFDTADTLLGLQRNAARAVQAGVLAEDGADAWVRRLATGTVVAGFTFYLVIAVA
jgi:ubiquinone/menaquinone biosynthesis C-methylase UbiE